MMATSLEQVFPEDLASRLCKSVSGLAWNHGWRSNPAMGFAHWNHDIAHGTTWNGLDVSSALSGEPLEAWDHISSVHLNNYRLIRCYANAHTHGVEGYPHTDSIRRDDLTVVVYMNREWKREWGGETVIFTDDNIALAQLPKLNRGLIFSGADLHCARPVSRICPELRQTLMFKCAPEGIDPQRDALQNLLEQHGASKRKHKNGNLTRHLLMTYDLLKRAGQPAGVCLAGGAHSVFGTGTYQDVTIHDEAAVEAVIGWSAMRLVKLFSSIQRAAQLDLACGSSTDILAMRAGGVVGVSKIELDALCMIECANLQEQGELDRWPRLSKLWSEANQ